MAGWFKKKVRAEGVAVKSGAELDIEAGGVFQIGGTTVTASAAKLNLIDVAVEGTTAATKAVTTDANGDTAFAGRFTTTDGVASGTARVVGGRAYANLASGTAHTNSTDEAVLGVYTIPANTLKAGSVLRCRALISVTADNANTTLTARLRLGATTLTGTELIVTSAVDTSANHVVVMDYTLSSTAAPGAAVSCRGSGYFSEPGAVGGAFKTAVLGTGGAGANFATNGALRLEVTADWSAADANSCRLEQLVVFID